MKKNKKLISAQINLLTKNENAHLAKKSQTRQSLIKHAAQNPMSQRVEKRKY